jgi:lipid A 3-O-deacylase
MTIQSTRIAGIIRTAAPIAVAAVAAIGPAPGPEMLPVPGAAFPRAHPAAVPRPGSGDLADPRRNGTTEPESRRWLRLPDPPLGSAPLFGIVAEARLGVLDHASDLVGVGKEDGLDISPELLFVSPGFLRVVGSPMPHVGAELNTAGDRSLYYTGLTWRLELLGLAHVELGFGGGIHDGDLGDTLESAELLLGCRWLFREAIGIGANFGERHTVALQADHFSHARLCSDHNDGIEALGIVYGYRF